MPENLPDDPQLLKQMLVKMLHSFPTATGNAKYSSGYS
ncbi:hypothetical protein PCH70_16120 [Pseudomonas cichorii JBC1]|nr:hypothetical protein PCH70_16120 [Pseudomonas cichorii JBC1]